MLDLLTALVAGTAGASPLPQGPSPAPVVVNEFCYDDAGVDDREFVELYNRSAAAVDVGGWVVATESPAGPGAVYTIPAGTVLQPGAFWVLGAPAVPHVDQVLVATDLFDDAAAAIELRTAANAVIDSVAYETGGGGFGPHPREGYGLRGELVTGDVAPVTWQRRRDGHDSDDNGCDFCAMRWTPGTANGGAQTVPPRSRFDFDAAAGTSLTATFDAAAVVATVQAPGAIANATGSTIALPPSPQGGNVAVVVDPAGGGVANWLRVPPSEGFLLETFVHVVGGNAAFAPPDPATGEGEAWGIGVCGTTGGAGEPPDWNGYHGQIPGAGLRPGATGIAWLAYVQQAQTTIVLADLGGGGAGVQVLGTVVATPGVDDGWQRLRLRVDGGELVANYGGTFGCDDGRRFTASGVGNCGGTVWLQYHECVANGALRTPLVLDRLEVFGIVPATVTQGGSPSPTTVGTPAIGTAGGSPVLGNTAFAIGGSGMVANGVGVLALGLGALNPGLNIPGAPPATKLYVNVVHASPLVFADGAGTSVFPLPIPCVNAFAGIPITAQIFDVDLALPYAIPLGATPGLRVVVGN